MISIIVAHDKNHIIGNNKNIPWNISDDLKLFAKKTINSVVIMGRKTWEGLPKKPLDKRENIIVSKTLKEENIAEYKNTTRANDLYQALDLAKSFSKDIFIIGGSEIYKESLERNIVDRICLSYIFGEHEGNKYFPYLKKGQWILDSSSLKIYKDFIYFEILKSKE